MFNTFDPRWFGRGWSRFPAYFAGIALLLSLSTSPAQAVACGDEISTSIRLTGDLGPCPGFGLIVVGPPPGAPDITIDLNGHHVIGSGTHSGLLIMSHGVVVKSGFIQNFGTGIRMDSAEDVMIYDLQFYNNATGIDVLFSRGVRVFDNTILGQIVGAGGIGISDSIDVFVYRNSIQEQSGFGIFIGLGTSTVSENQISNNLGGILVGGDGGSTVRGNQIFNNQGNAIEVRFSLSGGNCTIANNDIDWNAGHGILVDGGQTRDCIVSDNRVRHSQLNGISIVGGVGHRITGNRLSGNALDLFWNGVVDACWALNVYRRSNPTGLPQCVNF